MSRITRETADGMRWMLLQKCTLQPVTLVYSMVLTTDSADPRYHRRIIYLQVKK